MFAIFRRSRTHGVVAAPRPFPYPPALHSGHRVMTAAFNIALVEWRCIFLSPLARAVLAIVQFIVGFVFINLLLQYANEAAQGTDLGVSDVVAGSLYGFSTILLLLIMPLMTMRLFAEERKTGAITPLFSAPVSLTEIVQIGRAHV